MRNIEILDCTLRDGAQANEARFGNDIITDIIGNLTDAGIDIIECGFVKKCDYDKDCTYFPSPSYAKPFLYKKHKNITYAALMDYGRYDVDSLEECDGTSFDLLRISFFEWDLDGVEEFLEKIKSKNYKFTIQPMDTFSYTNEDVEKVVSIANRLKPEALAMVDTYSLATFADIDRIYNIYKKILDPQIKIGFHSHNNQLNSFALAQYFMEISKLDDRSIIIDSSLYGMGRGGGNLNTEIITEYLNTTGNKNYFMKPILDSIDKYILELKQKYKWGYSLAMLYAGLYGVHVFTTAYLENKPNVTSYDLKCMFEMLDDHKKKRYDYDYLDQIYDEYMKRGERK